MSDLPLPEPWDYCYEWDGPYGTRKFSQASHNGNRPDRSVPIYTADKMHAHAAAVSAQDNARLREAIQHYEAALKEAWPEGAKGKSFEHWNTARIAAVHGSQP
jgi:hypothetical protein